MDGVRGNSPGKDETPAGSLRALAGNSPVVDDASRAPPGDMPGRTRPQEEEEDEYDMGSTVKLARGHDQGNTKDLSPREKAEKGMRLRRKLKEPMKKKIFGMSKGLLTVLFTCLMSVGGMAEEMFMEPFYDLWSVLTPRSSSTRPSCLELFAGCCAHHRRFCRPRPWSAEATRPEVW